MAPATVPANTVLANTAPAVRISPLNFPNGTGPGCSPTSSVAVVVLDPVPPGALTRVAGVPR